jgi:hypothetical protein
LFQCLSTRHEEVWKSRGIAPCILKLSIKLCVVKCLVLRPDCSTSPSRKAPSWLVGLGRLGERQSLSGRLKIVSLGPVGNQSRNGLIIWYIKVKGKVHPCTGTEALYRPNSLQGE